MIQNKAVRLAKMFGLAIIFVKSFYPPKPCPKMLIKFRSSFFTQRSQILIEIAYVLMVLPKKKEYVVNFKTQLLSSYLQSLFLKVAFQKERICFSNLQISKIKKFQKNILSLKFKFPPITVYCYWREI